MENKLPELCVACRHLKEAHLGRRVRKQGRAHDRVWICYQCLGRPKIVVCNKTRSPLELEARAAVKETGYRYVEEHPIGPFKYDLAIPALRLLLEIDSKRWHSHPSRIARDKKKNKAAKAEGWEVTRISSKSVESIGFLVNQAVLRREAEVASTDSDR
jgi:very-short-patch-repair endonuclease